MERREWRKESRKWRLQVGRMGKMGGKVGEKSATGKEASTNELGDE